MPRAERVRAALAACPLVIVSDCWPTDTTQFANMVLPAAGWGEKDGTVTNSERCISRQRAFRVPPGEARPDWWMMTEVARHIGWRTQFPYRRAADIFREHAALSAFENDGSTRRIFDIGALSELSDEDYDRMPPIQWPVSGGASKHRSGTERLFGDGTGFATRDGRARVVPTPYRPLPAADKRWPLLLNTGRVRDQWHTMTRTGRVPRLMAHQGEPVLDMHPADMARLGLASGGMARIESEHGAMITPVRPSTDQRRGEIFAPMHWTDQFTSAGPIDRIIGAATDPISGQPELKATPVRVAPVATLWRGLLLRQTERPITEYCYWARIPLANGQAFELAGWEPLPGGRDTEAWVIELLGAPSTAELVIYADPSHGVFRYASLVSGRLEATLFLARSAASLPQRDTLAGLLGTAIEAEARTGLLAGQSAATAAIADPGRTVCTCFAVGLHTLYRAIADRRLASVAEIGNLLRAGTSCGSCIPEISAILRDARIAATAA